MSKVAKEFIDAYTEAVHNFGTNHVNICWWGTFLANKDRFHSEFLKTFSKIFNQKGFESPYRSYLFSLSILIKNILKWHAYLLRSYNYTLKAKSYNKTGLQNKYKEQTVSLIKTISYDHSFKDDSFDDPMFEQLNQFLKSKNENVITFIDPLNDVKKAISKASKQLDVVTFYSYCSFSDYIKIYLLTWQAFFCPPKGRPSYKGHSLRKIMLRQYRKEIFNPVLMNGLLMGYSYARLSKKINFKKVFMTYENISWERPFIAGIKRVTPDTEIVGFQHTVVPQICTNYFMPPSEDIHCPLPDRILTNGEITKKVLEELGNYKNIKIESAAAIRQKEILESDYKMLERSKVLLVALEGSPHTEDTANYVFKYLKLLPGWKIILRTHPMMPVEKLNHLFNLDIYQNSQIIISKGTSLIDDLKRSGFVIYWGSTVGLEALKMGIPAINYSRGDTLSYDPAFLYKGLKKNVDHSVDLSEVLNSMLELDLEQFQKLQEEASDFVGRYFHPLTEKNMCKFI